MNIYVGNLASTTTEDDLKKAFEEFGEVSSSRILKDKFSGEPRGFGFVEMPNIAEAQTAISTLNGKSLLGQEVTVNEARPRPERGRSGGHGGGGGGPRGRGGFGGRGRY
jgi:RNA recognition motif-containing protein